MLSTSSSRTTTHSRLFILALVIFLGLTVTIFHRFIGTVVFSIFFYYAARPLHRRINHVLGWPTISALSAILIFLVPTVLLVSYTGLIAYTELHTLVQSLPTNALHTYLVASPISLPTPKTFLSQSSLQQLPSLIHTILGYVGIIGNGVIHLFVMFVLAFYFLRDGHRLNQWFCSLLVTEDTPVAEYIHAVDTDLHHILFGNIINAVLIAIIAAISYNAINFIAPSGLSIPIPTLLGFLTGVGSLIPVVGMKIVYIPVTAYVTALTYLTKSPQQLWFPVLVFAVSLVIVDGIPDMILRPYVSGKSLHVGMVMISYILGPLLFGWYGLFLGPILFVLGLHFVRIIVPPYLHELDLTTSSSDRSSPTTTSTTTTISALPGIHTGHSNTEDTPPSSSHSEN